MDTHFTDRDFHCMKTMGGSAGIVTSAELLFSFPVKEVLNSNKLPKNTFFFSKLRRNIRDCSAEYGSQWHNNTSLAALSLGYRDIVERKKMDKSKARKKMNKDKVGYDIQADVLDHIDEQYKHELEMYEEAMSALCADDYMFTKCSIEIGVSGPTKRRYDPPNFYPTVKPLIDGLTDSLWWSDDDFSNITSMEFHWLPPNDRKKYQFHMTITAAPE